MRPAYLPAALSLTLGSPLRCFFAPPSLAPGLPLCGGAPARARLAALWRRSRSARFAALWRRSRSARFAALAHARFAASDGGAPAHARFAALCFGGALAPLGSPLRRGGFRLRQRLFVRPSGRRSRSRPVRRPLFRRGGFRRRQRLFVRPFGRRSRSRSVRRPLFRRRSRSRPARRFGAFSRRPRPKAVKKIKKISDRYFIFS